MQPQRIKCPVEVTLDVIGGKWKVLILWYLQFGKMRYFQLQRCVPEVTQKMLSQQLRELERDGLIERTVHPTVPPSVEYALTPHGRQVEPVLTAMLKFGEVHVEMNTIPACTVMQPEGKRTQEIQEQNL